MLQNKPLLVLQTHPHTATWRGVVLLLLFLLTGCAENRPSSIPQLPVFYELFLNSAEAKPLLAPGGYIYITQPSTAYAQIGFGGLLLIQSPIKENQIYAYDLACPHEVDRNTKVQVNDQLEAQCPKCGSKFSIIYGGGNPVSGVAQSPLLSYRTQLMGTQLIITNR